MENSEKASNNNGSASEETPKDEGATSAAPASPSSPEIDWKSQAAYLAAELENMRKRFEREKSDFLRFANEDLLRKLFPVMDNLLLALSSVKEMEKKQEAQIPHALFENLFKGVEMTLKHFEQTLSQLGVEIVPTVGEVFNPEFHEAVGQSQEASLGNGIVSKEFQRGFRLYGRVIRPAKVVVNSI
jgi:molecular chaperone GrpE